MKKLFFEFIRRGLTAAGFGPIILAIIYLILEKVNVIKNLDVNQVSIEIFSLFILAFIAGGINVIYQIEKLPLIFAIFIHGCTLYIAYLSAYLVNDWLYIGVIPILVFSGVFIIGFILIWLIVYLFIRRSTKRMNEMLINQNNNKKTT